MNTRTTLILALVAAVVAGYWFYSEAQKRTKGDQKEAKPEIARALYDPKPKDVDRIEYTDRAGKKFVFKKQDGAWQMTEPLAAPASEFEVNALSDRLGEIKYVKTYNADDKDRPSDAVSGLAKPNAVVKLYTGEKLQADVIIGNKTPTGTGTYVKTGDSDVIYQANTDLKSTFDKKLENFRDKRVVKFELKDVKKVEVQGLQNYVVTQNDGKWIVESPTPSRGDKEAIEKIVRPISSLYVQDWKEDDPIALRVYQLDKPRLKFTIDTEREIPAKNKPGDPNTKPADTQPSTEKKTVALLIGGATDPSATSYFAKLESAPWVFAIGESTVKDLSTALNDLRDKRLAASDSAGEINKIEASNAGGQMTLTKGAKGDWTFEDGTPADSAAAEDLAKTVQNLKAVEFAAGDEPLLQHDWTKPRGWIAVSRRGVIGAPVKVLIGNPTSSGQLVYAKNDAEQLVGAISKTDADQLLAGPVSYRDRTVLKFVRDQANKIEIARAGYDTVVLEKKADKWSMIEPVKAGADADAVRNILADVSNLRAKSVVSTSDKAEYGLNEPEVKLAVYTEVPVPRPPTTAPAVKPAATAPAMTEAPKPPATAPARPLAAATTRPAAPQKKTPQERVKQLEELLEYTTTTLRSEGKENPKATEMLKEELAKARREAGMTTQPAIQGAPQAPADEVSAATQPAATQPAAPPPPEIKVYHLSITRKGGKTYAARDDQPMVYELDSKIFDDATAEMHDRQILKFDVNNVTELGFEHGSTQVAVRKTGTNWKYVADPLVPIDDQKVTEKLNVFRDLKTHRYAAYKADDLAPFGLDKELERMWVVLNDGQRLEVLLSKTGPVNDAEMSRYAMLAGDQKAVFVLKGDQASKFQQRLEDFTKTAGQPGAGTPTPAPTGAVE